MSLRIYHRKKDIPEDIKYIHCNDLFFDAYTTLSDTSFVKRVLQDIDKSQRISDNIVLSRVPGFGGIYKECLSTGCKTILNIEQHPNKCFNVNECGNNALRWLPKITEGNIYWRIPSCLYKGDDSCDIIFSGKHFTNFSEFLTYCREEIDDFDRMV